MFRIRIPQSRDFSAWSDRAERILIKGMIILAAALLVFQSAMQIPALRPLLSPTDRLEGIPYEAHSG